MISSNLEDQLAGMLTTDDEEIKKGNQITGGPKPGQDEDLEPEEDTDDEEYDELDDEKFRERLDTEFPLSDGETEEDL
jgi:hypothetical protein